MENVDLTVPLPAIVKVPALAIDSVDISFDMEVKSSKSSKEDKKSWEISGSVGLKIEPFHMDVNIKG